MSLRGENIREMNEQVCTGTEMIQHWINEIKTKTTPQIIPEAEVLIIENKTVVSLLVIEY